MADLDRSYVKSANRRALVSRPSPSPSADPKRYTAISLIPQVDNHASETYEILAGLKAEVPDDTVDINENIPYPWAFHPTPMLSADAKDVMPSKPVPVPSSSRGQPRGQRALDHSREDLFPSRFQKPLLIKRNFDAPSLKELVATRKRKHSTAAEGPGGAPGWRSAASWASRRHHAPLRAPVADASAGRGARAGGVGGGLGARLGTPMRLAEPRGAAGGRGASTPSSEVTTPLRTRTPFTQDGSSLRARMPASSAGSHSPPPPSQPFAPSRMPTMLSPSASARSSLGFTSSYSSPGFSSSGSASKPKPWVNAAPKASPVGLGLGSRSRRRSPSPPTRRFSVSAGSGHTPFGR